MRVLDDAFVDADGDLICDVPIPDERGGTTTHEVNVTSLLSPGARRTGDTTILLDEAERAAVGRCPTNPALPINQEAARTVMRRLESRDIEPAWKVCPAADYPPSGGEGA